MRVLLLTVLWWIGIAAGTAQERKDSLPQRNYSLHFQATFIAQYHFDFSAKYSGNNSLMGSEPIRASVSGTGFLSYKPFRHTYFVFNPEAAGGKGLSKTLGVAGFPNGEVYRVGDPNPKPFIARLYAEQRFPLSKRQENVEDDLNQIQETTNKDYLSVAVGKFSLTDFFGNSEISHDPRTQFMNWSLMGNGAWDYPANTRGYTMGTVVQLLYHNWAFRSAMVAVPIEANGPELQFKWGKAMGLVWELERSHLFYRDESHYSTIHVGAFLNKANMGSYLLANNGVPPPDITVSRMYGRSKAGFYASMDHHFGKVHYFIKGSWNDGKNETWAFTEIDRSIAMGLQFDGDSWGRKNDRLGVSFVSNGLSDEHRRYLTLGGYGFLIGDGALNYGHESIVEAYYSFPVFRRLFISPDYQFVTNPAYNKDRGPVHIVAIRMHLEL